MLKKLSRKTNFVLIGIVVGLFVGVSIRQALGDTTDVLGTVRADNLTVNTSGQYDNGLIVANGNALVPNGKVGIGTMNPSEALTVTGKVVSSDGFCIGTICIDETQLKALLSGGTVPPPVNPTSYNLAVIKDGTGTGTVVSSPTGIDCGSLCSHDFPINAQVTLTANKSNGSTFAGWSGACTGTGTCTVVLSAVKNVKATFTLSGGTNPPPTPVCTGTHPTAGNGVILHDYTNVVAGPSISNTDWKYGEVSCGWECTAPMLRDGDNGCKNPTPGSGITITLNNLSGGKFSGIALTPVIPFGGGTFAGFGGVNGTFTTDNNGVTPEFWIGGNLSEITLSSVVVVVRIPGYKIRNATGCTSSVEIWSGTTLNRCTGMRNGTNVVINMVPGDIASLPVMYLDKLTYHRGESISGFVSGGDPNNMWGCLDSPNTQVGYECNSGRTDVWRKLTVPYNGHADEWYVDATNQGDSVRLGGLFIEQGYPFGTYTMYVKTGQWGTQLVSKSISVVQ